MYKFSFHVCRTLTWVAVVEIVVILTVVRMVPLLCVCLFVILHQHPKEDDEDDLQDEAGDRQFEPHVGICVCHVFFPVR